MQCYLAKVTQLANSRISTKIQTAAIPNLMIFLHFQKKLISEEINLKKKTLERNISSVALEAQKGSLRMANFCVFGSILNSKVFPKRFCLEKKISNWSLI